MAMLSDEEGQVHMPMLSSPQLLHLYWYRQTCFIGTLIESSIAAIADNRTNALSYTLAVSTKQLMTDWLSFLSAFTPFIASLDKNF